METAVRLFSKPIKTPDALFVHLLQDICYAEQQITKALPQMIEKAADPAIRTAFEIHLRDTKGQIGRLEEVFRLHGTEAKGAPCQAIDGIIKEARETFRDIDDQGCCRRPCSRPPRRSSIARSPATAR